MPSQPSIAPSAAGLLRSLEGVLHVDGDRLVIDDERALRDRGVRDLAWTSAFGEDEGAVTAARWIVWEAAQELRSNIVSEAEEEKEKARHASDELVAAAEGQAAEIAENARHQRDEAGREVEQARQQVQRFIKEAEEAAEERARAV